MAISAYSESDHLCKSLYKRRKSNHPTKQIFIPEEPCDVIKQQQSFTTLLSERPPTLSHPGSRDMWVSAIFRLLAVMAFGEAEIH
ncbi:hypothetical protein CDAR_545681 [Caerostris darwini]|uniref:Uncharacterized protein n=1 Tax=Caerostris darwini TaxID=1538125 RepID=A0AAV4WU34_9ARAC|nr:hypothetical protein CDAR_545681 [Caerostris darwini]